MSSLPNLRPPDIELGHVRDGYPALANWVSRDPDSETFVFRKFGRLAARNILHLQCKLIALEKEIDDLDEEARQSPDLEARQASRRYETLISRSENGNNSEKKRVQKLEEVKGLLEEYCKKFESFSHSTQKNVYRQREMYGETIRKAYRK